MVLLTLEFWEKILGKLGILGEKQWKNGNFVVWDNEAQQVSLDLGILGENPGNFVAWDNEAQGELLGAAHSF